ncbi:hypothetical protein [Desulfurobacterium crinifex]
MGKRKRNKGKRERGNRKISAWNLAVNMVKRLERNYPYVDFELFDANFSGRLVVKLGLYPLGVCFINGRSIQEVERKVRRIIKSMETSFVKCPFCGTKINIFDAALGKCKCGVIFKRPIVSSSDALFEDDIQRKLAEAFDSELVERYLSSGFRFDEIFEGLKIFHLLGVRFYAIHRNIRLKTENEVLTSSPIKRILLQEGFKCIEIGKWKETLWEGWVNGEKRQLILDEKSENVFIICYMTVIPINVEEETGADFMELFEEELGDISTFPFTRKNDLDEWYSGIFVPQEEVMRKGINEVIKNATRRFKEAEERALFRAFKEMRRNETSR